MRKCTARRVFRGSALVLREKLQLTLRRRCAFDVIMNAEVNGFFGSLFGFLDNVRPARAFAFPFIILSLKTLKAFLYEK